MNKCECNNEQSIDIGMMVLTGHHEYCSKRRHKNEKYLRELINDLVRGMEIWGHDEDGIHEMAWDAYTRAKGLLCQPINTRSSDE